MDLGIQFIRVAGSLVLVLALLLAALYGIKRLGTRFRKSGDNPWIQILSRSYLDPRHYLLVVKSQDQLFLLGVSPQGMQLLTPLEKRPGDSSPEEVPQ